MVDIGRNQEALLFAIQDAETCDCKASLYELQIRIPIVLNKVDIVDRYRVVRKRIQKQIDERLLQIPNDKKIEHQRQLHEQSDIIDSITAEQVIVGSKSRVYTGAQMDIIKIMYEECNKEYLLS